MISQSYLSLLVGDLYLGLRVAQVRALFTLPLHLQAPLLPERLAYIDMFTPFRAPDTHSNLYSVSRSTRSHAPVSTIVPIEDIVCSCHLSPKYGTDHDPNSFSSGNALEVCKTFTLNKYIDHSTFFNYNSHLFK
jgi:hypothetical protein